MPRPESVIPPITSPSVPAVEPTTRELLPADSNDSKIFLNVNLSCFLKIKLQIITKIVAPKAVLEGE